MLGESLGNPTTIGSGNQTHGLPFYYSSYCTVLHRKRLICVPLLGQHTMQAAQTLQEGTAPPCSGLLPSLEETANAWWCLELVHLPNPLDNTSLETWTSWFRHLGFPDPTPGLYRDVQTSQGWKLSAAYQATSLKSLIVSSHKIPIVFSCIQESLSLLLPTNNLLFKIFLRRLTSRFRSSQSYTKLAIQIRTQDSSIILEYF